MSQTPYTILEIGSGSYKLHRNNHAGSKGFTYKYESSLGKNMLNATSLNPESVKTALRSLDQEILMRLQEFSVEPAQVLVFATAAIRKAMQDPAKSAQNFIKELERRGFRDIRVFSEDEECLYAAKGVIAEISRLYPKLSNYSILDSGGASHQIIEVEHSSQIHKYKSIGLGSHSDLSKLSQEADFRALGFSTVEALVLIGTSGKILSAIEGMSPKFLVAIHKQLSEHKDISLRRKILSSLIQASTHISPTEQQVAIDLLVDFRLAVLPKAFEIILNCALQVQAKRFLHSNRQAMHYVSAKGFTLKSEI